MGKVDISMAIFHSELLVWQRVCELTRLRSPGVVAAGFWDERWRALPVERVGSLEPKWLMSNLIE